MNPYEYPHVKCRSCLHGEEGNHDWRAKQGVGGRASSKTSCRSLKTAVIQWGQRGQTCCRRHRPHGRLDSPDRKREEMCKFAMIAQPMFSKTPPAVTKNGTDAKLIAKKGFPDTDHQTSCWHNGNNDHEGFTRLCQNQNSKFFHLSNAPFYKC